MEKWQEDLVTNNLNLVYYCYEKLPKTPVTLTYKDDLISEGNVGLCKAAKTWDPEAKVTFSSYAFSCIRNEMLMFIRRDKNKTGNTASLDILVPDTEGLYLSDMVGDETGIDDKVLYKQLLGKLRREIKPKHYDIFVMWLNGTKQVDIAKVIGCTRSYVNKVLWNVKKHCKKRGEIWSK